MLGWNLNCCNLNCCDVSSDAKLIDKSENSVKFNHGAAANFDLYQLVVNRLSLPTVQSVGLHSACEPNVNLPAEGVKHNQVKSTSPSDFLMTGTKFASKYLNPDCLKLSQEITDLCTISPHFSVFSRGFQSSVGVGAMLKS
eukprot:Gb_25534 [translate_table: standard]